VIIKSAIDIYAITNSSDEEFPELLLLRRVAVKLHPRSISRPLVGRDGIYFIGICGSEGKRIFISHNPTIPPTTEVLGPLESSCGLDSSHRQFGTMASFTYGLSHIGMATYDLVSHSSHHRWLQLNKLSISIDGAIIHDLAGLDDNVGRVVLMCSGNNNCFLIMDII